MRHGKLQPFKVTTGLYGRPVLGCKGSCVVDCSVVTISGIADFGLFLQEPESLAEGLIRLKDLGDDFFQVDKKTYKVSGQNSGKVYGLGDTLRVKLRGVDLDLKTVDFVVLK